jgi:hypothetical protein
MTLFIQDTFAEARDRGILAPGFVGTYADIRNIVLELDADEARWEQMAELRNEQYWESNWPGADRYRWEEEQDRLRNPFDPQTGYGLAA